MACYADGNVLLLLAFEVPVATEVAVTTALAKQVHLLQININHKDRKMPRSTVTVR